GPGQLLPTAVAGPAARAAAAGEEPDVPAGHRPRRLHPVRPLHPRLLRRPAELRHRPDRQGRRYADRFRPERGDEGVLLRGVRRVPDLLPDRRDHGWPARPGQGPARTAGEVGATDARCPGPDPDRTAIGCQDDAALDARADISPEELKPMLGR